MQENRTDFLKQCMSEVGNMPLDDFNRAYCVRCLNPECARSGANASHFNRRIREWRPILFENVPRAGDEDQGYTQIRSKKFLPAGHQGGYELRSEATVPTVSQASSQFRPTGPSAGAVPKQVPNTGIQATDQAPTNVPAQEQTQAPIQGPAAPAAPAPAPAPAAPQTLQNTPFEQGSMLPGAERIEQPGSTYVFGDD